MRIFSGSESLTLSTYERFPSQIIYFKYLISYHELFERANRFKLTRTQRAHYVLTSNHLTIWFFTLCNKLDLDRWRSNHR